LRTNATDFKAAWQQYIQGIIQETAPYQITNGGPVIGINALLTRDKIETNDVNSNSNWYVDRDK